MLIFLFILLIAASLFISYYFSNKISNQRKQLLLLKYQNNNLKHKAKTDTPINITIRYITPQFNKGTIIEDCKLYIAPFLDSFTINTLKHSTSVEIQDSAEINNETWYEISLLTENRINSKGWIRSQYIKISSVNDVLSEF